MSELEQLAESIRQSFPAAELRLTLPVRPGQAGWLDLSRDGTSIAVEWRPGTGFGVSVLSDLEADPCAGLFEGPDEVFGRLADAERYILELLDSTAVRRNRVKPAAVAR
jgi:hypothetical protein